jgi:hypothetical protein
LPYLDITLLVEESRSMIGELDFEKRRNRSVKFCDVESELPIWIDIYKINREK